MLLYPFEQLDLCRILLVLKPRPMKRLVAMMMCAVSLVAAAQFPSLPYNPDENGDGLIGVVDLQGLLANYGNEFASAVVSEDGGHAIVGVGSLTYFDCLFSCASLPGRWALIDEYSAAMAAAEIESGYAWIDLKSHHWHQQGNVVTAYRTNGTEADFVHGDSWGNSHDCFCAAKQLPRVEYFTCKASCSDGYAALDVCVNEKLAEGWYPFQSQRQQQVYNDCFWQPLWRWAE